MKTATKSAIISTTISTPSAIDTVAQPKLRKAEIIEAAARREYDKRKVEYAEWSTAMHNEEADLKNKVVDWARKSADRLITAGTVQLPGVYRNYARIDLDRLDLPEGLSKELKAHERKYYQAKSNPDFKKILKEMKILFDRAGAPVSRERVNRVHALLSDKAACKALDDMVDSLRNPPKPQLAAATA
jgi:hypothetical protein